MPMQYASLVRSPQAATGGSLRDRVCLGIGTAPVPQPGTNIKSARNWNAKLEGRRGILFQSFLTQDAARDEYAHALCTLRSMPASRKPRCNENDGSGMTSAKSKVSGLPSALSASGARPSRPLFADCLLLAIGAVPIDPVGTAAVEGTTDQMPL